MQAKCLNYLLLLFPLFIFTGNVFSQSEKELLAQLVKEEQEAINALVLYPEDTRRTILISTLYPEALIRIESIQNQTSLGFRELVEGYSRETQEMLWDLSRYPALLADLVSVASQDVKLESVLQNYPEVVHDRATIAVEEYPVLLNRIYEVQVSADNAFEFTISNYSAEVKEAFFELLKLPEVLSLLTEHIRLTIIVGDLYKREPRWVEHKADSLSLVVARQNTEELEDWKNGLEEDPEAAAELQSSVDAYTEEYNYDDDYYEYYDEPIEVNVHNHYYYNYPYWFGYPSWYESPRWRLYPNWYNWGFYNNHSSVVVVIGMPSYHFMSWYFNRPHHHHHWSHLSTHFVRHYHRNHYANSSIAINVVNWKEKNNAVVSDKWLENDRNLNSRIKEFGKFEVDRVAFNERNPKTKLTQTDFLERNVSSYPTVSKAIKEKPVSKPNELFSQKKGNQDDRVIYTKEPKEVKAQKDIPRTYRKRPEVIPAKPGKEKAPKVNKTIPTRKVPEVNKGRNYHKNTWDKTKQKKKPATPVRIPQTTKKQIVKKPTPTRVKKRKN